MCDFGDSLNIADACSRVARCFYMDKTCIRTHCGADGLGVCCIHKCYFNIVFFGQVFAEQQVCRAVTYLGNNCMVAAVQKRDEYTCQSRHAAGKYGAVLRASQRTELFLQYHLVDIAVAGIDVAFRPAPINGRTVCGDAIVGSHVNRLVDCAKSIVFSGTAVYGYGMDICMFFHCNPPLICMGFLRWHNHNTV